MNNLIAINLALKNALDEQGCNQQTTTYPVNYECGTSGMDICARPTLRDCIKRQIENAHSQGWLLEELNELDDLLEKNPDVARILDLIDIVGW